MAVDEVGVAGDEVGVAVDEAGDALPPRPPPPGDPSPRRPFEARAGVEEAVDQLLAPLTSGGGSAYLGEPVTQLEHALQAAARAAEVGAPDALVVAALLHDVGWLLGGRDDDHAARSAGHLQRWLPPSVTGPVRLHVEAKRWLCATSAGYYDLLSDASKRTLAHQGGAMDAGALAEFDAGPWASDAVRLRRWDDEAKVADLVVPGLDHWRPLVARLLMST